MKNRLLILNLALPATSGILVFIYIYFGRTGFIPPVDKELWLYILFFLTGICIGLSMMLVDHYFKKKWNSGSSIATMLTLQLIGKIFLALVILVLAGAIFILSSKNIQPADIWSRYYNEIIKLLILTTGIMLIYGLVSFTIQSYNFYAYHKLERLRQERDQMELQFEALRAQLSPHYLFNCLNTISSLVYKSASQTEDFIRRMAKTFQYVLNNDKKKLVTIAEEIEFVKSFNYLLKVRFENQLLLKIDIHKEHFSGLIPPLTLQMLLENAVKHNVIDDNNKLTVHIYSNDDDYIYVENSRTISSLPRESFSIGLENIKKRYHHLCERSIEIYDEDNFKIKLPVITKITVENE